MAILLLHEMGHFLQTLRHRVPASLPFFIPMPISAIGTMGAVIGMDGMKANRRQLFDIGLTGPLAGLVVALPLVWIGVENAKIVDVPPPVYNHEPEFIFHAPWVVSMMIQHLKPEIQPGQMLEDNAFLLAGWVGLLITGLNMMPVSQLDGGHVIYALFGRERAHRIAKAFVIVAILYIIFNDAIIWAPMLVLVLIGPTHPPSADDSVELSLPQKLIGYASLSIPFLCFPPQGITFQ
jgi:membrane-associated protease RseP (regulator of RpoE activity)